MRSRNRNPIALCLLAIAAALCCVGCGGKGSTTVTYRPSQLPLEIRLKQEDGGLWTVSGGLVTPAGVFAIEQQFDMREQFTYIVLRDQSKGTDQVFKVGATGYVELHTTGEHKLRIKREDKKIIVDVDTLSGTIDVLVFPESSAIGRIDFGQDDPDIVVFDDRRLVIEYPSIFSSSDSLNLDAIQSVTLRRTLHHKSVVFTWKSATEHEPLELSLADQANADRNFSELQSTLKAIAPGVRFERQTPASGTIVALLCTVLVVGITGLGVGLLRSGGVLKGCLGTLVVVVFGLTSACSLIYLLSDLEVVMALFR